MVRLQGWGPEFGDQTESSEALEFRASVGDRDSGTRILRIKDPELCTSIRIQNQGLG